MKILIRQLLLILVISINITSSLAQLAGDYRSVGNGDWTTLATWQRFNGTSWVTPIPITEGYPGQNAGTYAVNIQAGHIVTISNSGIVTATMGMLTIDGTLHLTGDNSSGGIDFFINTPIISITPPAGNIDFFRKSNLLLPANAVLCVSAGGLVTFPNCNNLHKIIINNKSYSCSGVSPTFDEIMTTGGIGNTTIPAFAPIDPLCQNSTPPLLPAMSTNGITGTWVPATISTATVGTATYTFTPSAGQCGATTMTMSIITNTLITPTFAAIDPLCQNSTPPALPATSTNGITGTWAPATLSTATVGTATYIFVPNDGQCATTATLELTTNSPIAPVFATIGPLCQNSTPPLLPSTSTNGITGTWVPASINTTTAGTATYIFSPAAGQCGNTVLVIIITTTIPITPTFDGIGTLCQNSTPPLLPSTSTNGITGTWAPATISTATAGTATYTFVPSAGQCATTATMTITTNAPDTPTFDGIGTLCQNSTAPILPTTSTNGVTGTWVPATISTATVGTATYTFVPIFGQCATTATLSITTNALITPTFAAFGPLCQNSMSPVLPSTSTNGITGTWVPATISTATVGAVTYTFVPAAGQCAATLAVTITTNAAVTPTFAAIGSLCQNSTAPVLPSTSTNGITGTWAPATISTATPGTATYTFTPAASQCATTLTVTITTNAAVTPTFAAVGPLCQNSTAPVLPTTSTNGITGTWAPATISTATVGTATYTFTPAAGQCATTATLEITTNSPIAPVFAPVGPLCHNSTAPVLPSTSTNGITGTWVPATISTVTVGTATYTFVPASGQCAATLAVTITTNAAVTPAFTPVGPLCQNSTAPALPATSTNGITGTWAPATISTATAGTATYTFTPAAGQCATTTTLVIMTDARITTAFAVIAPLCHNNTAPILPATSTNGITGTWVPATISTATVGTATYTFTPASGQCATTATMTITTNAAVTPTFAAFGPVCQNSTSPLLPATSTNGVTGTWVPATISTATVGAVTYTFVPAAGQCASTLAVTITTNAAVTPTFTPVGSLCQNSTAPALPAASTNGITGTWAPATISTATAGTATYTFTPAAGQCATTTTLVITTDARITTAFAVIAPLCHNSTPPVLPGTSTNGVTGTWVPATISTATVGTATYTFTPASGQCATTATMTITTNATVTPAFSTFGPLCQNSMPPLLPSTSTNGITGTWVPATISTATVGTATYTFVPAAGQCASTLAVTITTSARITPTFTAIGPLCQNSTAPALPATSTNGITGTWAPATISTATAGTATYTFTPAAGQCATTTTLVITTDARITTAFTPLGSLCKNSTPPLLPATSTNGVTGTWVPATISTATVGTATYTFTPAAGQCATTATMTITTNAAVTPTFAPVGPQCQNSTAPALPSTSTNGITGTWVPATISTATVGTATYTFVPAAGQCASTLAVTITTNAAVTPIFAAIGPLCQNSTAPALPATSTNGVTGTWAPATISTATAGTATYTFTPAAGQCAATLAMNITTNGPITPAFTAIGPLCHNNTAPVLPSTSTNGVTGTWAAATISTATIGTTTYTFTPDAGQCGATSITMDIKIDIQITPVFALVGPLCQNSGLIALPVTSTNGITGTWVPASVNTNILGTTNYTFTPAANQCGTTTAALIITTDTPITPTFDGIGPLCQNSTAPALPATSTNGITGTWVPATISTATVGTATYTFTPAAGQCATTATLEITTNSPIAPVFAPVGPLCQNSTPPPLATASTNGITGTWVPATISTATIGTATYTFVPASGQCAATLAVTITTNAAVTPIFAAIGPLCQNSTAPALPATSTNGVTGTWAPATISTATAGTATYTFTPAAGQCATTTTLFITTNARITTAFTTLGPLCQNSTPPVLPGTSTNGVTGTWVPATISTATVGTATYTFTPAAGQCATTATMTITKNTAVTPTFAPVGPLCQNSTPPPLATASTNGITGTWVPATISTATVGTATYTFVPAAGQCASTLAVNITTNAAVTPTFTPVGSLCQNSTATPLPSKSTNGIAGTWAPATISTATAGTATYTFTPAAGQCATTATLNITTNARITTAFTPLGSLCKNSTPPLLPATSTNGVTGTWVPATISTATVGTATYTFTPASGQCATTATMTITTNATVTPTFAAFGPLCQNSTAPLLPSTSTNGITGTWVPATISTATVGAVTYTFVPAAGQCASTLAVTITTNAAVTPIFAAIGPLCQNSTAPALPATSTNGVTGTWAPATISTATAGTATYTFTPAAGQCATTTTLFITTNARITTAFTTLGPLCQNSTPPVLPGTSTNGVTGTWVPATISTATVGTATYTFTPAAGQCATTATMTITKNTAVTPTFAPVGPLCQNSLPPLLPSTSTNGITGTWVPATISTATVGAVTYTFVPETGQCATLITLNVTTNARITPVFAVIGPLCQNSTAPALPATSTNGITGTWAPATISTATAGTATYTFTPAAGQCATTTTLVITTDARITTAFTPLGSLCKNSTPPPLPATSTNGVTGTWVPATISTATVGTATYTFTPAAGQCATTATMTITTNAAVTPTFAPVGPQCQNSTAPALPATSTNGITGTWVPATISTATVGTATYTFVPETGRCASTLAVTITTNAAVTPTFTAIEPLCQNSTAPALPSTSTNGITGTWTPATISTANAGTATYTFTPSAGQCAATLAMNITTNAAVTPAFAAIGSLCQNSTPPLLPTTSTNGITGTWVPATISTATAGTATYTFVPETGQCATLITLNVTTNARITPAFAAIGPLCQNSTPPLLPSTSTNGITGNWVPATISTTTIGTITYTFTPGTGQCAAATTSIYVTTDTQITPTFIPVGFQCQNSTPPALPATSTNGITGTWVPATISTATVGTAIYTFTPAVGQCSTSAITMSIMTGVQITPAFSPVVPLCQNSTPPILPATSTNGITGTWTPATISTATAGTATYTFVPETGQCATLITLNVTTNARITPAFAAIGPLCQNSTSPLLPTMSTNGITGTWVPATISTASVGTAIYTFVPETGQCATLITLNVTTNARITPAFAAIGPLCQNSTPPLLPSTSTNGITGTWVPATISTATAGTAAYTFTPTAGQCTTTLAVKIITNARITPTFAAIESLCLNSTPPTLPTTSTNGITGTWVPATISTITAGTAIYTFVPYDGQCSSNSVTMNIKTGTSIAPAFPAIGPLPQNSTPPLLPATSTNGITGTWVPATINTATVGTATYAFTPTAGQCGATTTATMTITTKALITPTFTPIGPLCQNSTPPALPSTSTNGITGTWVSSKISTATVGTTTYTFIPAAGQYAITTLMEIKTEVRITSDFATIGPLCQNSTPPALPATSTNGITGTWVPTTISTATAGKATYTFTPVAGQCASTVSLVITTNARIKTTLAPVGPLCQNSNDIRLSATSINGFTGTWVPTSISTANAGIATYTFTPVADQCATKETLTITTDARTAPAFTAIGPLCQNSTAPILPATSTNNIIGKWIPSTISTANVGTTTYTFSPFLAQCAATLTVNITTDARIAPSFAPIDQVFLNSTPPELQNTSTNGITGTWSPSKITTTAFGKTNYIFTPDSGQCASAANLIITIENKAIISGANLIGACQHVLLDASKSRGDIVKYEWSSVDKGGEFTRQSGVTTEFLLSSSYTGSLPADFRIRLLVTDRLGNTFSDTTTIKVDSKPIAEVYSNGVLETGAIVVVDGSVSTGTVLSYMWYTLGGKIVGPVNEPTVKLNRIGLYTLEVTDVYGCKSSKSFQFPLKDHQIIANPDYARTSWSKDTTINVLQNDRSTVDLVPGTVHVIKPSARGKTKVNTNGSITYVPYVGRIGKDEFVYEVCDVLNLCSSATVTVDIYGIVAPEAFSPNGDGVNDLLEFKGLENYPKSQLYVYTRAGMLVYRSEDYTNNWDGTTVYGTGSGAEKLPTSTYYYILKLGGTDRSMKGFVYIGY